MSIWDDLFGTSEAFFRVGKGGPGLKNAAGAFEVRNNADSAPANLTAANLAYVNDLRAMAFGGATDSSVTLDGTVAAPSWATKSGNVYTLTRDVFLDTLTLSGTAVLVTGSGSGTFAIYCRTLDISACAVGALRCNGNNATSSAAAAAVLAGTLGGGGVAGAGATGGTGVGTQAAAPTNQSAANGGAGGAGGAGGNGVPNAGGAARAGATVSSACPRNGWFQYLARGLQLIVGGAGGAGGSAGGGDGANVGGNGGGAGSGAGVLVIYAETIITSASTPAGAIQTVGGNGFSGAQPAAGNTGGGGGGAAGGGGWIYIVFRNRVGPVISGLLSVVGGTPGTGGLSRGTGAAGSNGVAGSNGRTTLVNMGTGAATETFGVATASF